MPSLMVHQNVPESEQVWHIESSNGLASAQVWPTRAVKVEWQDGTSETIPARTRCLLAGSPSVDLTSLDYYVVVGQGQASAPVLAPITAIGTFDTLIAAQPWGILRVLGKWGSAPYWPGGSSTGSALPAGTKGDILYYNGTAWVVRHIGNPTDVLYVDPATKLPVWESLTALATLISPLLPVSPGGVVGSGVAALFLGDSIEAAPAGWQNVSFVPDAHWTPGVDVTAKFVTDGGTPYPGSRTIWRNSPATTGETCAIRLGFVLSSGVTGAQLQLQEDDQIDGVWLNGASIFGGGGPVRGQITMPPVTLTTAQLLPGAFNVLAVQGKNIYPPDAFLNFALSVF